MKKILLFGGSGLVGTGLKKLLSDRYQIKAPTHAEVDVTKKEQIFKIIEETHPDYIIYVVGLSSMDMAEQEPEFAYSLNSNAPALVAKEAASFNIPIMYFSSNAVFDGFEQNRSYKETDNTNPLSVYGKSKLIGEQMVMNISDKNCVARIIMPYSTISTKRKNFVLLSLEAFKNGKNVYGISDQLINPIYISSLANAVDAIIKNGAKGIYNIGATDYATNIEFIRKLARNFGFSENLIRETSFKDFFKGKKAVRTKFCWLDVSKFQKEFGRNILQSIDDDIKKFKMDFEIQIN